MAQPEPKIPSPALADVGKGRFLGQRGATLERYDGTAWDQVGRFGSARDAGVALDEAVGAGADPSTLCVVEIGPSPGARALMIAGALVLVVAAAFALYVVFG